MSLINFSQIHPRAFAHPADKGAMSAFAQIPMLPELLRKVSQLSFEERLRAHHMLNSVQLGPRQFPSIWRMVHGVAERLGIPAPKTYVSRQGAANAFAFGKSVHSIVVTTELIDLMSERELEGILAHEMGHILCEHLLYMDVGLALTSGALPSFARILPGLEESVNGLFYAWFRAAEYSADRAALLILEDPEPLAASLSRLAGVPRRLDNEFDLRLFAEQVKDYREEATLWSKIVTFGMGTFLTHPEPAKRVGSILDWAKSAEYRAILKGRYLTRFEVEALERVQIEGVRSCPSCRRPVGQAPICECGLVQDPRQQQLCPLNPDHVNGIDWNFCVACGAELKPDAGHNEIPGY
jgi:Zn-dependent protease with chaperone function